MSNFECINRVELAGRVGSVRIEEVSGQKIARFSMCTNRAFRSDAGSLYVQTDWHNVVAWSGEGIADFGTLGKGVFVKVRGTLRTKVYTNGSGVECRLTEVFAHSLEVINETEGSVNE